MFKKPHKIIQLILILFCGVFTFSLLNYPVYSDEITDLENQINQTNEELAKKSGTLSAIEKKIAEISGSNYSLSQKIGLINDEINKLKKSIDNTEADLNKKIKDIEEKQALLEKKKETIDNVSSDLYMESRSRMSQFFLSRNGWDDLMEGFYVKKRTITVLKDEVEKISGEFMSLNESRAELEKQKGDLEQERKDLNKSYSLLADEKAKLQSELNAQYASKTSVSSQISSLKSQLSNLQKTLLYARQGGTTVDPSLVPSVGNDLGSLAIFNSKAPSGYFDVFSIGAYTHRNGMSQWGAKARADAGQSYTKILSFYYAGKTLKTGTVKVNGTNESIMTKISVKGYGKVNFEDYYLLGIKEIPESWPMEVLKAQAIAARTYAVRYTNNGRKEICTTESCQVFSTPLKTGRWVEAVNSTRGQILTNSDKTAASTQFAAVHGGWVNGVGWDTYDTSKPVGFINTWDNKSNVSWMYRSWFRRDYSLSSTVDSASCYRNPWLSPQEMADIVNAASRLSVLGANGESLDPRIYPIFDRCHSSGNPYSFTQMRNVSDTKFTKIILTQVTSGNGWTSNIKFVNEDGRSFTVSGDYFKLAYNLRAPGYLSIPQSSFVHIDIQKKI